MYYRNVNRPDFNYILRYAIQNNNTDIIDKIITNDTPLYNCYLVTFAKKNYVEIVKKLFYRISRNKSIYLLEGAARGGNSELFFWLYSRHCKYNKNLFKYGIFGGNLDILDFLLIKGKYYNESFIMDYYDLKLNDEKLFNLKKWLKLNSINCDFHFFE